MTSDAAGVLLPGFYLTERYSTPATPPLGFLCRKIRIPDDPRIIAALGEILAVLSNPDVWQAAPGDQDTLQTCAQITRMWFDMFNNPCAIGTIQPYATEAIPDDMLPCDGTIYANADYPDLAAVIAATFKPDADHFQTPNLNGRSVVGTGTADYVGAVLDWQLGDKVGADEITLITDQMPAHAHLDSGHVHTVLGAAPFVQTLGVGVPTASAIPAVQTAGVGNANLTNTGGDAPHSNTPPQLALPFGIVYR